MSVAAGRLAGIRVSPRSTSRLVNSSAGPRAKSSNAGADDADHAQRDPACGFGAGSAELDELRRLIPPWVTRLYGGSFAATRRTYRHYTPWGRLAEWRRRYEIVVDRLMEDVRADPKFENRTDVLTLMPHTYQDGSVMSRNHIGELAADATSRRT